jgi:hypothetical protein
MRSIIFALLLSFSTAALTQEARPVELASDAPDRHIVVAGDTLWGIAARFLKDPFRWPELWKMNAEQVKNPHRIYPGQVVILDRSGSEPQLRLGTVVKLEPQVRVEVPPQEIPSIPSQAIEPFLARPLVVDPARFEGAPRIVGTQENRVLTGNGDLVFATGIDPDVALWQIYRPGRPLVDPDSGETIGTETLYLGDARVAGAPGEVTPLLITAARLDIGRGDYLMPASRAEFASYMPHPPARPVSGRIIAQYGRIGEGGPHSVVSLTRGKQDGLEAGHVLALHHAGQTVTNRFGDVPQTNVIPGGRYGLMFVFRVFERVSYALVMEASRPVAPGDRFSQP